MADTLTPATVSGYLTAAGGAPLTFTNKANGAAIETYTHPRTGYYNVTLPAGEYEMAYEGKTRKLTVISGKHYEIDGILCDITVSSVYADGKVTVTVCTNSDTDVPVKLLAENMTGICGEAVIPANDALTLTGELVDSAKPYVGLVIPNGNLAEKVEFVDERC